ncbi:MAG: MTH1187 family thiamine-binding protein [Candidatus Omnitrophica bacterium]|nr:MTH1187 family thiamine-binding protein [Candidatus Omnitrophota bacterium]
MPIMEISIVPLGTGTASVSGHVANAVNVLKKQKGIKYELTSMGTIIEADSVRQLLAIAGKMHRTVLSDKVVRVVTTIKIDDRRDRKLTAKGKIKSVQKRLRVLNGRF